MRVGIFAWADPADVPKTHGPVSSRRRERAAVARESNPLDWAHVTVQRGIQVACLDIPDTDRMVIAAASERSPIGRVGHCLNPVLVTAAFAFKLAARRFPKSDYL